METLSLTIGILGVATTAILGLVAYRLSFVNQQYSARRTIGDLHSEMARLRCAYPEVKTVCREWDDPHRKRMYGHADPAAQALVVRYEAYVDVGLEFCNTTLAAVARRLVHPTDFERQYRPLIHLFLAENWPFIRYALDGPYLSAFVRDEISARARAGHDWAAAHARVTAGGSATPEPHVTGT